MFGDVQPHGRLYRIDDDGYICNDASLDLLPDGLRPLVDATIEVYRDHLGDDLHGVYLRGSAVRGTFVWGVSDLDTWAVSRRPIDTGRRVVVAPYRDDQARLQAAFPEVRGIELCHTHLARLEADDARFARMLFATEAVVVWGEDVRPQLGRFRPGPDTLGHALHVAEAVQDILDMDGEDTAHHCVWVAKALVRAGLEVHAHEHGQYSRDLWPCFALFAAFHPDQAPLMFEALQLAIRPTDDPAVLREALLRFQQHLVPLVDRAPVAS
jgi:predicted nucleotidyltransferase